MRSDVDLLDSLLQSQGVIIETLRQEEIDVYLFLADRYQATSDIRTDHIFQFVFRSYYRLDNAGLTDAFKDLYFETLAECRKGSRIELPLLCRRLYDIPNRKGQKTLQFSFATKLVSMADKELPIFDLYVAKAYRFVAPQTDRGLDARIEAYMTFYEHLRTSANWLKQQPDYCRFLDNVGNARRGWERLTEARKTDFLLWTAGKVDLMQQEQARGT
jgi:hypothetical protein